MAKKDTAEPVIVYEQTYHVQVRLDDPGPPKRDGRRGRVLLEDHQAPYEVVRWLKSPKCCKANRSSGKAVFIWINDEVIADNGLSDPNLAGEEMPPEPPSLPALRGAETLPLDLIADLRKKLEAQLTHTETSLQAAREAHQTEISQLRAARQAELAECDRQIKEARERVTKALKEEDEEMDLLSKRRRQRADELTAMSSDLAKDAETHAETRRLMAKHNSAGMVESVVEGVVKLSEGIKDGPLEAIAHGAAALLMKKAGVKVDE